jgi:hypothetical protein
MLSASTVVLIDNRIIGRRYPLIVAKPRGRLLGALQSCLTKLDPKTHDRVFLDHDPDGTAILEVFAVLGPGDEEIRIVIYPIRDPATRSDAEEIPFSAIARELLHERFCGFLGEGGEE